MTNKPTRWQMFKTKMSMGKPFAQVHDMTHLDPKNRTIIRFKDKFIELWEDEEGTIVSYGWGRSPDMFPDTNINDFWTAVAPSDKKCGGYDECDCAGYNDCFSQIKDIFK